MDAVYRFVATWFVPIMILATILVAWITGVRDWMQIAILVIVGLIVGAIARWMIMKTVSNDSTINGAMASAVAIAISAASIWLFKDTILNFIGGILPIGKTALKAAFW